MKEILFIGRGKQAIASLVEAQEQLRLVARDSMEEVDDENWKSANVIVIGEGVPLGLVVRARRRNHLACIIVFDRAPGPEEYLSILRAGALLVPEAALEPPHGLEVLEEVCERSVGLRTGDDRVLLPDERFAAIGILAAEIAHEVNNPATFVITNLTVLLDYVDAIAKFHRRLKEEFSATSTLDESTFLALWSEFDLGYVNEDVSSLVERSLGGLERIHKIVRDLRFFSTERRRSRERTNIQRLIEATLGLVRHEARFRASIELNFQGSQMVACDANRLSQVLLNILVNALHAHDTATVDDNWLRITTGQSADNFVIEIADNAGGIDAEVLPRIFDPFFTTKSPGIGTGIGLSISRDIIREMGGDITVDSVQGKGSTFRILLPVGASESEEDE